MKTITTTAIVALMTATIGLAAAAPAFAQDAPARQGQMHHQGKGSGGHDGQRDHGRGMGGMGGMRGFLNLTNPDAVEIALVRLSQRVDLTAEQQPLFDAFKTAAMSAAEDFSGVLEGIRPAAPAAGQTPTRPDMSDMLATRIELTSAQLAALEAVQPSATAFFDSLTDAQKAELMPERRGGERGQRSMGRTAPMAPMAPPAAPASPAPATNG